MRVSRKRLLRPALALLGGAALLAQSAGIMAQVRRDAEPAPVLPSPRAVPMAPACGPPMLSATTPPVKLAPAQPEATDFVLPINLATALRLADARPLVVAAAQASVETAAAQLEHARVLWLPNTYLGASEYAHLGGSAGNSGTEFTNSRNQLMLGGGVTAVFATTDAIFTPLASRQVLRSRQIDLQTARNDALLQTAEAYFRVQEARGRLAGAQDAVEKGKELAKKIQALGKGLTPPIEADRARAELAELEQTAAADRGDWMVASADLTRVLRLNPTAAVAPLEPAYLKVTLIPVGEPVDALIPVALTTRPELASQQALVQATLLRLKQERMRPLIPSVLLMGNPVPAAPGGYLMGGAFTSSVSGQSNPWAGRLDPSVQVVWEMRNLGLGNRALVRERRAEQKQSLIELLRVQDMVAAEVAQAHAQVAAAAIKATKAEIAVKESWETYQGNFKGLGETTRFGDTLVLVTRPQEAVAALTMLHRAYDNYFTAINDYNRAEFRLYRALGYPASNIACNPATGDVLPIPTDRPQMEGFRDGSHR
jgi:outer membrane protein TolC